MCKRETALLSLLVTAALSGACSKEMAHQEKLITGRQEALKPVPDTLQARLQNEAKALPPMAADLDTLKRGRERFEINCTPCHDSLGHANGRIVQRGYFPPPRFDSARVKALPQEAIEAVIASGVGHMHGFGSLIGDSDRRAIAAYVRLLGIRGEMPRSVLDDSDLAALEKAGVK